MSTMKMLIVEDEETSRLLLNAILKPLGRCDQAVDGSDAVELVKSALAEEQHYDIIFLDIMMPRLDGQKALQAIRDLEAESGIKSSERCKVIMVTALSEQNQVLEAYMRGGATDYLTKPIERQKIMDAIERLGLKA